MVSKVAKANQLMSKVVEVTNELNNYNCITSANWEIRYFDDEKFEAVINVESYQMVSSQFQPFIRNFVKENQLNCRYGFGFTASARLYFKI